MLATETYAINKAIEDLDERIEDLDEELEDVDESSKTSDLLSARRDRLSYQRNGLRWQRDEEGWDDAEIELGAMTAGEDAMMNREIPDNAEQKERRLWFVAASSEAGPYVEDDLEDTFAGLAGCHPAFVQWAEAKVNSLGISGEVGNGSSTSSRETKASETSETEPDTTTTSSSDSPTA